jgi:hypothetical protein
MPSFKMRTHTGEPGKSVDYHLMIFTVGSVHHRTALHVDAAGDWRLSHPATGIKITDVYDTYKGVTCASRDVSVKMAKELAKATFEALISQHGSDKFNGAIANAMLKYGDQQKAQVEADKNRQALLRGMSRTARKASYTI